MTFILKHTSHHDQQIWFLVRLGEQWGHDPRYRFIDATTQDRSQAKQFATEEDARACWSEAGKPGNWDTEEVA